MNSSIARMAVNICRIMSVVAMLRALENPQPYQYQASSHPLLTPDKEIATDNIKDGIITRWDMTITPKDFKAVLNLVKPLYQHATHILSFLPPSEVSHGPMPTVTHSLRHWVSNLPVHSCWSRLRLWESSPTLPSPG